MLTPQLAILAVFAAAPPAAPAGRSIDPAVPTAVPAPEGEEVEIDGAALVDDSAAAPAPTQAVALGPKPAIAVVPEQEKRRWPESKRRGVLLQAGVGAGGCGQDQCEALKAVPWFNLTGGYRFGRFAPILTLQGGLGPAKKAEILVSDGETFTISNAKDTRGFLHVGVGTLLHLLTATPFDPYFGLTIGYLRTRLRSRGDLGVVEQPGVVGEFDFNEKVHRGTLGIIVGMNFRVLQRFMVGPRFDILVPFAGKACGQSGDTAKVCTKLADLEDVDPGQFFPRPWAVTLLLGMVL